MRGLAPYLVGGIAAVLVVDHLAVPSVGSAMSGWFTGPEMAISTVERGHKADRLVPVHAATERRPAIASVEVVGLRDTAIVYRDREGRVLFRTDPVSNATLVAKDVVLPEITIRETGQSAVNPVSIETGQSAVNPVSIEAPVHAPERAKLPTGCDPAFSPLTLPSLSRVPSRCIS